ncbi:hypothetical protein RHSIM_Rhsim07G0098500 [Rhododendron simsii]|uniref:Uncharacterized protein n=1 Tax=Rhododendron simsii TaxID=118357 RepID=A0A834GNI6_RHOSS|nr:hypothetical protein RHSIM_Rhsim07G0098500 [Rhododendron simsii]
MFMSWIIYYIVLNIVVCFANVPVKLEISSNIGDGGEVESLAESPISSAKVRHWFPWFQAQVGRHEVVEEILVAYPDLIYSLDEEGRIALGIAVMNRDIDIYNLTFRMRYVSR